jgi:hypothetical protein
MAPVDIHHSQGSTEAAVQKTRSTLQQEHKQSHVLSFLPIRMYLTHQTRLQERALCMQYWPSAEIFMKTVLYI